MSRFPRPSPHPSLALIATVGGRLGARHERLEAPADLDEWLAEFGYAAPPTQAVDLTAFRELREAILDVVEGARTGVRPPPDGVRLVNETTAQSAPVAEWADWRFVPQAGVQAARAAVARDAVLLVTGPEAQDLHQCEAADCATVFVRSSTERVRRWCTSNGCGNRVRVAAHRRSSTDRDISKRGGAASD